MSQVVPGSGRAPATVPAERTPDVFGPRVHRVASWATPIAVGLVYGYWAASNRRAGGPITGWNVLFGLVTALAFAVAYVVVREIAEGRRREAHAALWAAFAGCAFGFLYSQTGSSVLLSVGLSLLVAAGFLVALVYRFATREEPGDPGDGRGTGGGTLPVQGADNTRTTKEGRART
ncbi:MULTISPECIES: transglutaminaseTgpA domain-containing protein [unclassified Streptomyces]|uniref:transglutaminaseTgpA domain-containing protein n=1 Tax=unclassified Streptomyces TaxID=2593676 RepID=UPI001F5BDAA0|nr:transglutaminaseTgpA domain-containing protein [Streptomyces sp. HSG2]